MTSGTNKTTYVIYTTEEGGRFKVVRASEDEFRAAVERGQWDETPNDWDSPRWQKPVDLVFIALLRVEDNHDFIFGCSRDDQAGIAAWERKRAMADMKSALGTA